LKTVTNSLLAVMLIQCAMIATLYWPDTSLIDMINRDRLVDFEPYRVDEVHVGDGQNNEAVLVNVGDHWILPDVGGLKVAPELIEKLIRGVLHARSGWPVARSVSAMQRFHLADYKFQRRLTLISQGELLGTIYLGTSPGFQKVYAKNSRRDAIFSIPFNSRDASARDADWLDKRTLQISAPLRLSFAGHRLKKQGNTWTVEAGGTPHEGELESLLVALASVQIENIADDKTQRTLSIAVPDLQMDIETTTKGTTYRFFTLGQQHYIHCSDHALFFGLNAEDFNRFAALDIERLAGQN
jgi:hypothetical protein